MSDMVSALSFVAAAIQNDANIHPGFAAGILTSLERGAVSGQNSPAIGQAHFAEKRPHEAEVKAIASGDDPLQFISEEVR